MATANITECVNFASESVGQAVGVTVMLQHLGDSLAKTSSFVRR